MKNGGLSYLCPKTPTSQSFPVPPDGKKVLISLLKR